MKTFAAIAMLSLILSGCPIFMHDSWDARNRCQQTIPILRREPTKQYRVVKMVEGKSDDDLAWEACGEGADAVLVSDVSGYSGAGDEKRIVIELASRRHGSKLQGLAIRFITPNTTPDN